MKKEIIKSWKITEVKNKTIAEPNKKDYALFVCENSFYNSYKVFVKCWKTNLIEKVTEGAYFEPTNWVPKAVKNEDSGEYFHFMQLELASFKQKPEIITIEVKDNNVTVENIIDSEVLN